MCVSYYGLLCLQVYVPASVATNVMSCDYDFSVGAAEAVAMALASKGCCLTTEERRKKTLYRVTHPQNSIFPGKTIQYDSIWAMCMRVFISSANVYAIVCP